MFISRCIAQHYECRKAKTAYILEQRKYMLSRQDITPSNIEDHRDAQRTQASLLVDTIEMEVVLVRSKGSQGTKRKNCLGMNNPRCKYLIPMKILKSNVFRTITFQNAYYFIVIIL